MKNLVFLLGERQVADWIQEFKDTKQTVSIRIGNTPICSCDPYCWVSLTDRKEIEACFIDGQTDSSEFLPLDWDSVEDFQESWNEKAIFDDFWWEELKELPPKKTFQYSDEAKGIESQMNEIKDQVSKLQQRLSNLQSDFEKQDKFVLEHQCKTKKRKTKKRKVEKGEAKLD